MRVAALDIGSNSIKLLVADRTRTGLREVLTRVAITRLSRGLLKDQKISNEAMDRTLEKLSEFKYIAEQKGARRIHAVATEAVRAAKNAKDFILRCEYEAGLIVRVLKSRDEAKLSFLGGTSGLEAGTAVVVDIGGASSEIILGQRGKVRGFWSLPVGVVLMTERHLKTDPPGSGEIGQVVQSMSKYLRNLPKPRGRARLIVIGGTGTTLMSMILRMEEIQSKRIHGRVVTLDRLYEHLDLLAMLPLEGRKRVSGLEPKRADIIVAGLVMLATAAEHFGFTKMQVSARGLRHGVLLGET